MKDHTLVKDGSGSRWVPNAVFELNPGRYTVIEQEKPKAKAKAKPKPEKE